MDDLGEAETVLGRDLRGGLARPDTIGQPDRGERAQQVPHVERHVVRLEDVPPGRIERLGQLGELEEALQVGHGAIAADAVDADERRSLGRSEDHVVAADRQVARRVPGMHAERGRRERGLGPQEARIEPHGLLVHRLARLAEQLERTGVVEADTDLGRQPLPATLEGVERLLGERLEAWHSVDEQGVLQSVRELG